MLQHAEFDRIGAAMARLLDAGRARAVETTAYRAAHPKYAEWPNLVSGAGAMLKGSCWCPPGATPVFHGALRPENALLEALAHRRRYGLPDQGALPLVVRSVRCRLARVLDLGDGENRVSMRVAEERMIETDWVSENFRGREALTQAVGRAAVLAGFEGLLAPSVVVPGSQNLVVFMQRLRKGSRIVLDEAG